MSALQRQQNGSVSLFVVIFASLLIITVGTAFIRIMIQGQMQTTANDLSKSALDSAYAGVEDAKRVIAEYYGRHCNIDPTPPQCTDLTTALNPGTGQWTDCRNDKFDEVSGGVRSNDGVVVKTTTASGSDSGADLNQAYTCLKVQMRPPDYVGALTPDMSRIIKLQSSSDNPIKIRIEWYMRQTGQGLNVNEDDATTPYTLPKQWPADRPPVIKAQLLQFPTYDEDNEANTGFTPSDFDNEVKNNASLFLLPSLNGAESSDTSPPSVFFILDGHEESPRPSPDTAKRVKCINAADRRYACSVDITLPDFTDSDGNVLKKTAYLKLSQFYSASNTDFRIKMFSADDPSRPLSFIDVQAVADSTGRANDLFRRVQSRIDIGGTSVPNPESAVDVTKSFCKEFIVTGDADTLKAGAHMGNSMPCPALPTTP